MADVAVSLPGDLAGIVSDAEGAARALNDRARPALRPFTRLLLRTEAIASSKVEGLQIDARTLARAEARADQGRRVGTDVAEVLGNVDAMELAIEHTSSGAVIGLSELTDVHAALLRQTNPRIAGSIRTVQNWIGGNDYNPCGAAFVPPPAEDVPGLLEDLCVFSDSDDLPPLLQAAIAHAQFETIHPFEDGNGRAGRALIHIILRRRGLTPEYMPPISVVLAADRERYIEGLVSFRAGDLDTWIELFATAVARSADLAERYLVRLSELQQRWREMLLDVSRLRSDAAAWAVIDVLPGHPVLTVPIAVAATSRSKSACSVAVTELVDAGVLEPLSAGTRNRAWEAVGLLDLLTSLEDGVGLTDR